MASEVEGEWDEEDVEEIWRLAMVLSISLSSSVAILGVLLPRSLSCVLSESRLLLTARKEDALGTDVK